MSWCECSIFLLPHKFLKKKKKKNLKIMLLGEKLVLQERNDFDIKQNSKEETKKQEIEERQTEILERIRKLNSIIDILNSTIPKKFENDNFKKTSLDIKLFKSEHPYIEQIQKEPFFYQIYFDDRMISFKSHNRFTKESNESYSIYLKIKSQIKKYKMKEEDIVFFDVCSGRVRIFFFFFSFFFSFFKSFFFCFFFFSFFKSFLFCFQKGMV